MSVASRSPDTMLGLTGTHGLEGEIEHFIGAAWVPKDLSQVSRIEQAGHITVAKVEHPLTGVLRLGIVAKFGVSLAQQAIDHDVVGDSLVQGFGLLQRSGVLLQGE